MKSGFRPAQGAEPRPAYVGFDEGLRQHMLGIYRNMGLALLVSASVAWLIASTQRFISQSSAHR